MYTYLIGWSNQDRWYYGARIVNKVPPEDDIWKEYFTSSKVVAEFRKQHGNPDVIKVDKVFETREEVFSYEDEYLQSVDAVKSEKWLNRHFRSSKWFLKPGQYKHSEKRKKQISEFLTGMRWWNNGIRETKSKKSPGQEWLPGRIEGKVKFDLTSEQISEFQKRSWASGTRKPHPQSWHDSRKGKPFTLNDDQRAKSKSTLQSMGKIRCSCIECKQEMSIRGFGKHFKVKHFNP